MMLARSADAAAATRHHYIGQGGHSSWVTGYFGTEPLTDPSLPRPAADALFPVAFMVEEHAGATLDPHFHRADQFQLFVAGDGFLGKQPIEPFSVHYADSYTPYGPILAGAQGVRYLTLRNGWDSGPQYMPQSIPVLRSGGGPRRQTRLTHIPEIALSAADEIAQAEIFSPGADGLAGWRYRIAPDRPFAAPDPAGGGGQYWIVAGGEAVVDGVALGRLSCLFVGPYDPQPALVAGPAGADLIVLQFPVHKPTASAAS
jgi:hypothetical protein